MVRASFAPAVSRQTIGSSAAEPHLLCEPTSITRRGGWEACDARRTKGVVGCEPQDGPARRIYVKHYQVDQVHSEVLEQSLREARELCQARECEFDVYLRASLRSA